MRQQNYSRFRIRVISLHTSSCDLCFPSAYNQTVSSLVQDHSQVYIYTSNDRSLGLFEFYFLSLSHRTELYHISLSFLSSASHYDKMQLLVLFIGGRKSVPFGKVSLRLRNAGLRRLGRLTCCRSSLNTSTTLAFSFADASR